MKRILIIATILMLSTAASAIQPRGYHGTPSASPYLVDLSVDSNGWLAKGTSIVTIWSDTDIQIKFLPEDLKAVTGTGAAKASTVIDIKASAMIPFEVRADQIQLIGAAAAEVYIWVEY